MQFVFHRRSKTRRDKKVLFCKLVLADKDIRTALYTCDAFIDLIQKWQGKTLPLEVSEAFVSAIIVSYSKPFVQSSNSFPGELPREWHKFDDKDLQHTHKEMLSHRHSLFAHSDPEVHKISIIPDGCLPASIGPKPPQVAYYISGRAIPPHNVVRFKAVCIDIQKRLEKASQKVLEELYSGMELPKRKFLLKYDDGL